MIAAGCYAGYDAVRGLITARTGRADADGRSLLHWEQAVHLDPERWLNGVFDALPVLAVPACYVYATLHFLITPAVLIWVYASRPAAYRPARTVLAVTTLTALVGFWRYPTAPPRLLPGGGFGDTLALFGRWGWWGADTSVPGPVAALANQYAAMPSLHVAWACWCAATVYRLTAGRTARVLAVGYPLLTTAVVLGTANHYLLDVVAGAAMWALTDWVPRLREVLPDRRRGPAKTAVDS